MKLERTYILLLSIILFVSITFLGCNSNDGGKIKETGYDETLVKQCRETFVKARTLQKKGKESEAIKVYKQCAIYNAEDTVTCDSLSPYVVNAILQMMNCYQASGEVDACSNYLSQLYKHPTPLIKKHCMRDLGVIYAYSLYRSDRMNEAQQMMRRSLKMTYDKPICERFFRDYSYATAVFYCNPRYKHLAFCYARKALTAAEHCKHTSGAEWVVSILANDYNSRGEMDKAISLYHQTINMSKAKKDTLGMAHGYINLSLLYVDWDMPAYANIFATRAIKILDDGMPRNPDIVAIAYLGKARAMKELARYDSMYYYIDVAATYGRRLPYLNSMSALDCMRGTTMVDLGSGDTLRQGMKLLQVVVQKGLQVSKARAFFALAKGYFKLNETAQGERMLDSMYYTLHNNEQPIFIKNAYQYALDHYIKVNDAQNILRYSKALLSENEAFQKRHTTRKLADMFVEINTVNQKQQLREYEIKAKNERLRFYIILCMAVSAVLLTVPFVLYKKKTHKMRMLLMKERLDNLSERMRRERKKHQDTKDQLTEMIRENKMQRNSYDLSAKMIKDEGESEFRNHFESIYPQFVPQLRSRADGLSHREELMCMLVALNQGNSQISDLLFIAYRSVVVAKYRIKQKMHLNPDENLDNVIRNMIGTDNEV